MTLSVGVVIPPVQVFPVAAEELSTKLDPGQIAFDPVEELTVKVGNGLMVMVNVLGGPSQPLSVSVA